MSAFTSYNTKNLKSLVKLSPTIKGLMTWLANRGNATWETKVRVASEKTGLGYYLLVEAFKQLEKLGFGTFVKGSKGHETRFKWKNSSKDIALSVMAKGAGL